MPQLGYNESTPGAPNEPNALDFSAILPEDSIIRNIYSDYSCNRNRFSVTLAFSGGNQASNCEALSRHISVIRMAIPWQIHEGV